MLKRRQLRESTLQFLYFHEMEGSQAPTNCETFWQFLTEPLRRQYLQQLMRSIEHFCDGRDGRLQEWIERKEKAELALAAYPETEVLKKGLKRMHEQESLWSSNFQALRRINLADSDDQVAEQLETQFAELFKTHAALIATRAEWLRQTQDFPKLRAILEPLEASVRRLQKTSERINMLEKPENFPEQADLQKLRDAKSDIAQLRSESSALAQAVLEKRIQIDAKIEDMLENFAAERLDLVDRSILRLASYELIFTELPTGIVINEAINLAKKFGTSDSGRFVNGLLDTLAKRIRPAKPDSTEIPEA